jgi:hypothetical protein
MSYVSYDDARFRAIKRSQRDAKPPIANHKIYPELFSLSKDKNIGDKIQRIDNAKP